MQRGRDGRSVVVSTKEMREIAREAHKRNLNRKLTPAQFKLLDPRGLHVLTPQFMHDRAQEQRVEPHLRCDGYVKLIGKNDPIEKMLDIPMQFLRGTLTPEQEQDAIEKGRAFRAYEDENNDDDLTESLTDAMEGVTDDEGKA